MGDRSQLTGRKTNISNIYLLFRKKILHTSMMTGAFIFIICHCLHVVHSLFINYLLFFKSTFLDFARKSCLGE